MNNVVDHEPLGQMLIPIDVSKYFHKAMIIGPKGQTLHDPFEIDIYQEGLEKLLSKMKEAKAKCKAKSKTFKAKAHNMIKLRTVTRQRIAGTKYIK